MIRAFFKVQRSLFKQCTFLKPTFKCMFIVLKLCTTIGTKAPTYECHRWWTSPSQSKIGEEGHLQRNSRPVQCVSSVKSTYGCIMFDGYGHCPSIKDNEHARRQSKTCADIHLKESMAAYPNKEIFLSNERNKNQFITLVIVNQCAGDADTWLTIKHLTLT